jgi:hypothetical protein
MFKINFSSLSYTQKGLIVGIFLALINFSWVAVSSISNNYPPLKITSCSKDKGCKTEVNQLTVSQVIFRMRDDLIAELPKAIFLIVVSTVIGFFIGRARDNQQKQVMLIGIFLALGYTAWIIYSSVSDGLSFGSYCPPNPPRGGSCMDINWSIIISKTFLKVIYRFPLMLCLVVIPSLVGYATNKRAGGLREFQNQNQTQKVEIQISNNISPRRIITFSWAGFILGVILGTTLFNYFKVFDTGAPFFVGILLLCGGAFLGFKYEKKFPSKSSKFGTTTDILLLVFMIITALLVLFFGMMTNANWSAIFS